MTINNLFDVNYYRTVNSDLAKAGLTTDAQLSSHFQTYGLNEGRAFSPFVDLNFYRASNSDLANLGFNNRQLYEHLQNYGISEGRHFSPVVDINYYLAVNKDLAQYNFSNEQLFEHLRSWGLNEGRQFSQFFDINSYKSYNQDLVGVGLNNNQLFEHFQTYGVYEGRQSSSSFSISYYRQTNTDLPTSFNNCDLYNHFVLYGHNEGRIAVPSNMPAPTDPSSNPSKANWTVMVYMAGNDLESYAIKDFLEMSNVGSDSNLNIVVQLDRTAEEDDTFDNWTDTRRGIINKADTPNLNWGTSIGEADMGDANTLSDFVNWSMTNYQADNYALVMWGHGSQLSVSYDDQTQDGISASELSGVLSGLSSEISLVGADGCLMGVLEFAYQIRNYASVFVGSQEVEPTDGWDYTPVLSELSANSLSAAQLATSIVDSYGEYYTSVENDSEETLCAIDLTNLRTSNPNNLITAIDSFAIALKDNASSKDRDRLNLHYSNLASFSDINYRDLGNLLTCVAGDTNMTASITTAAQTALNAYNSTIIHNYSSISQRATGLSIYFQSLDSNPESYYNSTNIAFATDTTWDEFLLGWVSPMAKILFDANFYRAANSDLASFSDVEAFSHFLDYGLNEGRAFSPFVDLEFYRSSNSDLASFSNSQLFDHLQNYGINEGRSFSPFVDLNYYRAATLGVDGLNNNQLFRHLRRYGLEAGTSFSAFVDLDAYKKFNPDLAKLYPSYRELLTHLEIYGLKEGRLFDSFVDLNLYLSVNSDLNRAFGGDRSLAFKHLVEYGLNEGRTFSQFFDLNYYRSNNPDLATAGIGSGKQLLKHFKLNGFYEGLAGRSDYAGNTLSTAHNITIDSNRKYVFDFVGTSDRDDYYQFTLNQTTTVNIYGRPFTHAIDGEMIDSTGSLLAPATTNVDNENSDEYILAPGTYFFHVQEIAGNTNYEFGIYTS